MGSRKPIKHSDMLADIINQHSTAHQRFEHTPLSLITIRQQLQSIKEHGKRLLVMKNPYTEPENLVVITLDKFYPRFVLGHYTNIDGIEIPYTLSYATILDKSSKYIIKVEGESPK